LAEREIKLELSDAAKGWLASVGYDPQYGARPLRRAIERYVENPLSNKILSGEFKAGATVLVDYDGEKLTFNTKKSSTRKATAKV